MERRKEEREGDGWIGKWRDRREGQTEGRTDMWKKGLKERWRDRKWEGGIKRRREGRMD